MNELPDERFYPKEMKHDFSVYERHVERYLQSIKFLGSLGKGQVWLDTACGCGYGTQILSLFANNIIGFDIDVASIKYAKENYNSSNIEFHDSMDNIQGESIDVVFSIETIEHMPIKEGLKFLNFIKKKMKKDATMIITTPIVPITDLSPANPYHSIEYSDKDFENLLLSSGFKIEDKYMIQTKFTDGLIKDQGYYKCKNDLLC